MSRWTNILPGLLLSCCVWLSGCVSAPDKVGQVSSDLQGDNAAFTIAVPFLLLGSFTQSVG